MPARSKIFEKKKDHKEILCSRISLSNASKPCRSCIKCLLNNQFKKNLNIPQTPKTPKVNRIRESLRDKISIPKFPIDQLFEEELSYLQTIEITQNDLDNLQYDLYTNGMIRPLFYL